MLSDEDTSDDGLWHALNCETPARRGLTVTKTSRSDYYISLTFTSHGIWASPLTKAHLSYTSAKIRRCNFRCCNFRRSTCDAQLDSRSYGETQGRHIAVMGTRVQTCKLGTFASSKPKICLPSHVRAVEKRRWSMHPRPQTKALCSKHGDHAMKRALRGRSVHDVKAEFGGDQTRTGGPRGVDRERSGCYDWVEVGVCMSLAVYTA